MKKFLFFLGVGILGGLIVAHIYVQGFFISWKRIVDSPEKPQSIVAINEGVWIKTTAGSVYHYPSNTTTPFTPMECDKDCWQKHEDAPDNDDNIFNSIGCGRRVPSTNWLVQSVSVCQSFGPQSVALIYGFDKNGDIYYWAHPIGDMDAFSYVAFPIQGIIYVILASIVYLFVDDAYKKIKEWKTPQNFEDYADN